MSALEDSVRHIEYSADNESDRQWAKEARAELAAQTAVIEAARKAVVAYPKAGKTLSDAMLVLYDALAEHDKVTK